MKLKKMLYLCRPNLGENLFATPCWELLSKEYDIYLLLQKRLVVAFKDYTFIKGIIIHDQYASDNIQKILNGTNCYYSYHHDEDVKFIKNNSKLYYISPYGVISDGNVFKKIGTGWISRTRKYMLKMNLMTLEQTSNFDCTVRVPSYNLPIEPSNAMIIYQGSKENLRKLPTSTIQKFVNAVPNATYLVTDETASELRFDQQKIKYLRTDPCTDENFNNIISLFKTKPKCMIGPDSGLTQLALGYKIPLVWLQSRININSVIDVQYKDLYKVYKRKHLSCKQDCSGCKAIIDDIYTSHGVFRVKGQTGWQELSCRLDSTPNCLDYSGTEIQEILSMIPQ